MLLESLQAWYQTPTGCWLRQCEQKQLRDWWPARTGATVLQMGGCADFLALVCNSHMMRYWLGPTQCVGLDIVASYDALPFRLDTLNVAVLMHILEFCENPLLVLKQIFQALAPGGYLLLFVFNAWSSWWVWQLFADKTRWPWQGRFLSPIQLQSLLKEAGYHIIRDQSFCFLPRSYFFEKLGQWIIPTLGIVNMVLVQKQVYGSTEVKRGRVVFVPLQPIVPLK